VQAVPYGQVVTIGRTTVSLHPAGHILGSAQVRVELPGSPVWVLSGDYKVAPDATCESFEPVRCDVFVTESTFGLPIYRWRPEPDLFREINDWWRHNASVSRTSIILAYSLGKAQRVLKGLDPSIGPLAVHGAVHAMNGAYARAGVVLPDAAYATPEIARQLRGRGLVIAPPSALGSPWIRKFADPEGGFSAATVSGWMRVRGSRRRQAIDRGFVVSDHADWPGLLSAIRATGASRVGVTHGYLQQMVRWLRESGLDAFVVPTRYTGEAGESEPEADQAVSPNEADE
jgi:putative mRNA 3-end processing factor